MVIILESIDYVTDMGSGLRIWHNSYQMTKILKLRAFAGKKIKITQNIDFACHKTENIGGFQEQFLKPSFGIMWLRDNLASKIKVYQTHTEKCYCVGQRIALQDLFHRSNIVLSKPVM